MELIRVKVDSDDDPLCYNAKERKGKKLTLALNIQATLTAHLKPARH
jgi:hypothetical protein